MDERSRINRLLIENTFRSGLTIISFVATLAVSVYGCDINGLEGLFLLPLTFALTCAFGGQYISYCRKSVGGLTLLLIMVLRYVITPVLICLSNSVVPGLNVSSAGFRWAILMMIIELITIVMASNYYWPRAIEKANTLPPIENNSQQSYKLSVFGILFLLAAAALLLTRGHLENVISHLSVWNTASTAKDELYTYDFNAFIIIRTVVCISLITAFGKKAQKVKFDIGLFVISCAVAAINIILYSYNERATLVETTIATLFVLLYFFPKYRKPLFIMTGIVMVILIGENFIGGTVRVGYGNQSDSTYVFRQLSNMSELYSNNVSTEGFAYDHFEQIRSSMSLATPFSEIVHYLQFTSLPGFRLFRELFSGVPTTFSLFMDALFGKGFILSNAGWSYYYGSFVFGWIIDIIIHVIFVKLIIYFYLKRQMKQDVWVIYISVICEIVCALGIMNNILILLATITGMPLYLHVFKKVNDLGSKIIIRK